MNNCPRKLTLALLLVLAISASNLSADQTTLDQAVNKYYAGHTDEAIAMIRPLATAGDADAQYLLGNILFTLSNAGQLTSMEDPARWYRMAADQDSAPANYALGVIHNNLWLQSRRDEDLQLAESYLQKALDLGMQEAQVVLSKLAGYRKDHRNKASLTYNNDSFASKREPSPEADSSRMTRAATTARKPATKLTDTLAGFESSGDLAADAELLRQMLSQLNEDGSLSENPDVDTLTRIMGSFESTKELLPDILRLFDHIEEASTINTAPGSN